MPAGMKCKHEADGLRRRKEKDCVCARVCVFLFSYPAFTLSIGCCCKAGSERVLLWRGAGVRCVLSVRVGSDVFVGAHLKVRLSLSVSVERVTMFIF